MTGGQFGGDVTRYPTSAATNLNPNPDPVVVPGTEPDRLKKSKKLSKRSLRAEHVVAVQASTSPTDAGGRSVCGPARAMLADADNKQEKQRARSKLRAGHAMRKQGRIAGAFRDVGERRSERLQAGEEVGKQNKRLDKRFGAALKSFGSDVATEIADTYGAGRYGKARSEMTDEQRDKLISNLERRSELKAGAQEEAGGQGLKQITGTTPNAESVVQPLSELANTTRKSTDSWAALAGALAQMRYLKSLKAWVLVSTPVNHYV